MPALPRTGWLALLVLATLGLGVGAHALWPSSAPALDCAPADVRWDGPEGIARCAPPGERAAAVAVSGPAGQALTLGLKLDLNRVTAEELALLPGVGPTLARALVAARPFRSWEQVDAVAGVGPVKLETLQRATTLGPP